MMSLLHAIDKFALFVDRAALTDHRSFAQPSTDRATIAR